MTDQTHTGRNRLSRPLVLEAATALADEDEAAARPFGANLLHYSLSRLYRLQYSKNVPIEVFDVREQPDVRYLVLCNDDDPAIDDY